MIKYLKIFASWLSVLI